MFPDLSAKRRRIASPDGADFLAELFQLLLFLSNGPAQTFQIGVIILQGCQTFLLLPVVFQHRLQGLAILGFQVIQGIQALLHLFKLFICELQGGHIIGKLPVKVI